MTFKPFRTLAGAVLVAWLGSAQGYIIESEALGEPVGQPPQAAYKVTITLPTNPDDDPGLNTFTVNWVVPKEQTSPQAPADLTADAMFRIASFNESLLVLNVALNNTFDPSFGVNSIVAFGFFVDPEVESASVANSDDPNNVIWTHNLESSLTGNFKNLDVCVFPDSNSCNGGSVLNGLPAGASDMLTLSLTGNFQSAETGEISVVMLSQFPVKFQGDYGSFEVPGEVDCCTRVPEPNGFALALLGLATLGMCGRRTLPSSRRTIARTRARHPLLAHPRATREL